MARGLKKRMETAGKFYTVDTFGTAIEGSRELEEAFAGKRSWQVWKKIATLISFLMVATFIVLIAQYGFERSGNLKSLLDPSLIGGSVVGFEPINIKSHYNITLTDIDDIMNNFKHLSKCSKKEALEVLQLLFTRVIDTTAPLLEYHIVKRNAAEEKKVVLDVTIKYRLIHNAINRVFKDDLKVRTAFLFGLSGQLLSEVASFFEN